MTWLSRNLSRLGSLDAMTDRQTGIVYYVGSGGKDTNDGKTWPARRLTIASGYSLCSLGDTLMIGEGTFTEDLTFDTDGVAIIGTGAGNGTTIGGTVISGTHIVTAGSNIFKDIGFYDVDTAGVVITLGNDANSDYNQFIDCSIVAEGTCTVGIHIDGTAGGANNTFKNCYFSQGDTACLLLDTGVVINNLIDNCVFFADSTANGHGIHLNHANVSGSVIRNCIVNGGGSTGTGIYIQAGDGNYVRGCSVEDLTTLYDIAANNYVIDCHEESQITADNTLQADLADLHTDIATVIAAVGGPALQLRVEQSEQGAVEEDSMVNFSISLFDIDAGHIVAANIDITGISSTLSKSTGGGAFAEGAIVDPVFAKTDGLVSSDFRFLAADWEIGDVYKLVVKGITVTIDGDTAHVKTLVWSGVILEELNVEAKIDAIQTDLGDPSGRTNLKTIIAMMGNPDIAGKTLYGNVGDFVGQTNLQTLLAALGIPDVAAKPLYTCLVTDRLDSATFGLNALKTLIDATDVVADNILAKGIGAGTVFYVDSAAANDTGDGLTAATAKKTIDAGVNLCTANNGDVVLVYASGGAAFDENANTAGVEMDTAGVTLLGVNKPLIANSNGGATAIISITAARCTVKGLYLNDAAIIGISIDGAGDDYNVIADNIIWGDMTCGIYMNDTDWNQIYGNHIAEMGTATRAGIKIAGSSRSNRIIDNWIDNTDYGIWLAAGTQTQNLLWRNSIAGSGQGTAKGIYLDGAGVAHTEIKDNSITDCVIAIDDSGTSTDISNNKQEDSIDRRNANLQQIAATTIDLNQAAASYDLFTGTTQDGILESLVIRLPNVDCSDDAALTSISIQTDDVTVSIIISAAAGAKANLTAESQHGWTGIIFIKAGTKIQLTIAGGAADAATVCDVVAKFVADTDGGYLV